MWNVADENMGLICKIAHKYAALCVNDPAVSFDDLVQAGRIGVFLADKTYNANRGKWSSWAALHIRNEISAAVGLKNGNVTHVQAVSLDTPLNDDKDAATLADTIADTSHTAEERAMIEADRQQIQAAFDALPEQERELAEYMRQGLSCAAAGRRMALTPYRTQALRASLQKHLRKSPAVCEYLGLDRAINYYQHKGIQRFYTTGSSIVEDIVMLREQTWEKKRKNYRV